MLPCHICYCVKALTMTSGTKRVPSPSLQWKKVGIPCNNQPEEMRKHTRTLTLIWMVVRPSSFLRCERVAHVRKPNTSFVAQNHDRKKLDLPAKINPTRWKRKWKHLPIWRRTCTRCVCCFREDLAMASSKKTCFRSFLGKNEKKLEIDATINPKH